MRQLPQQISSSRLPSTFAGSEERPAVVSSEVYKLSLSQNPIFLQRWLDSSRHVHLDSGRCLKNNFGSLCD